MLHTNINLAYYDRVIAFHGSNSGIEVLTGKQIIEGLRATNSADSVIVGFSYASVPVSESGGVDADDLIPILTGAASVASAPASASAFASGSKSSGADNSNSNSSSNSKAKANANANANANAAGATGC